jgi:membrane protease YdiL (CAAX protease family)
MGSLAKFRSLRSKRRIERELKALHLMNQKLWTIHLAVAFLFLPVIAVVSVMIIRSFGWNSEKLIPILLTLYGLSLVFWWAALRWWLPVRILGWIIGLLSILTLSGWPVFSVDKEFKKEVRSAKLKHAIAKREAMLKSLLGATP